MDGSESCDMGAGNKLGFSRSTAIVLFHGTVSLALNLALLKFHALSFWHGFMLVQDELLKEMPHRITA